MLRYKYLNNFDSAMNNTETKYGWLAAPQVWSLYFDPPVLSDEQAGAQAYVSLKNETDKVVVFERAGCLFIFNFHPTKSFADYRVGVDVAGEYSVVLSSDEKRFGGFDRVDMNVKHTTTPLEWNNRKNWLHVRTCCGLRSSIVLRG